MASDLRGHETDVLPARAAIDASFLALAELASDVVWIASADLRSSYQNRTWRQYTGSAGLDECGWLQSFHPVDLPAVLECWQQAVRKCEPVELSFRLRRSDGVYGSFRGRFAPLQAEDNQPVGYFAVCAEECAANPTGTAAQAIGTQEQQVQVRLLEKAFALVPSFIYVLDLATRGNLYGNKKAADYIGYLQEELPALGSGLLPALMHPDDQGRFDDYLTRFEQARDDDVLEFDYRVRHKDGTWRWLRSRDAVFSRSPAGRPAAIIGVATDITERKNHEQALRRNEDRHRALIAHASQTIWIADPTGKVLESGAWLESFTGAKDPAPGNGDRWLELVHPDDREILRTAREQALRELKPLAVQFRVRRHDGEFGCLAVRGVPLFEPGGALREWVGTLQDITDQRRSAEALLTSERHLRRVLDSLFTFVGVLRPDGTLIETNKAPLDAAGITLDEVSGKPFWETYWFNHSPQVQARLRAAIDAAGRGESSRFEIEVHMAGTALTAIDFMLVPLRGETGGIQNLIASAVDISERSQADKALRKQNERLRLLWETAGVLLSTHNPGSMLQDLFERISKHLRIDTCLHYLVSEQPDTLRLQFSTGVPAEAVASLVRVNVGQAVCGSVALSRQPFVASFIQHSDDPRVDLFKSLGLRAFACNPLLAEEQVLGTLSFGSRVRDVFDEDELEFMETITNYVTVAYERMRLLNQHQERDRRKNEFIAMLAHELRNPLAPIRNAVQYLRLKGVTDPDVNWARDMIDRQVTNLVHLIDDLLEISRITRGKIQLRKEPVSLSSVLAHAVESVQPAINDKKHVLSLDLPADPLPVFGDPTRLEQIFVNLLANAAKYTDEGGFIDVIARRDADHALVRIRDNGIGIPVEMLSRIFEPFAQVDQSLDRSKGGLGIGLTLAKSLAEMHGGSVQATSAGTGQGSEFTLRLPLSEESARPAVPHPEPSSGADTGQPTRVLIVEDNPDAATGIGKLLSTCGYDVTVAHDGESGVSLATTFHPEIVLIDIGLPGMSGYEVVRRFRELPELEGTRLIAVSGFGQEADHARSRDAGFEHHFVKPVDFDALKAHLRRVHS